MKTNRMGGEGEAAHSFGVDSLGYCTPSITVSGTELSGAEPHLESAQHPEESELMDLIKPYLLREGTFNYRAM